MLRPRFTTTMCAFKLTKSQNAMNAAEITDKLGLHSLRQRAWVRFLFGTLLLLNLVGDANTIYSTSNLLALRRVMVSTRVSSGCPPTSSSGELKSFHRLLSHQTL